jgi:integrase
MARKRCKTKYPSIYGETLADGDITYYAAYRDENGKPKFAKHGRKSRGKTAKTASVWRADLMRGKAKTKQQERNEEKVRKSRSIVHLYNDHYLKDRNGKGRNDSTFNNWVEPYWGGKDMEKVTNIDAANYEVWLKAQTSNRGKPLSDQSVKHAIGLYRRVLRHAKRHIEGFFLLIDDFSVPEVDNEVTEDLTTEEFASLLKVLMADTVPAKGKTGKTYQCKINRSVADILLLILNTGMRRGECLKLMWGHVNLDRGTIVLKDPKGKVDVNIPMSSGARAVLERQKKTSMYVFPGKDGGKRLHIDVQARKIRDLAGLPKTFRPCHGLRHYFGTELHAKGANIKVISELMGHKSIEITKRYIAAREEQKVAAVELVSIGGER